MLQHGSCSLLNSVLCQNCWLLNTAEHESCPILGTARDKTMLIVSKLIVATGNYSSRACQDSINTLERDWIRIGGCTIACCPVLEVCCWAASNGWASRMSAVAILFRYKLTNAMTWKHKKLQMLEYLAKYKMLKERVSQHLGRDWATTFQVGNPLQTTFYTHIYIWDTGVAGDAAVTPRQVIVG